MALFGCKSMVLRPSMRLHLEIPRMATAARCSALSGVFRFMGVRQPQALPFLPATVSDFCFWSAVPASPRNFTVEEGSKFTVMNGTWTAVIVPQSSQYSTNSLVSIAMFGSCPLPH